MTNQEHDLNQDQKTAQQNQGGQPKQNPGQQSQDSAQQDAAPGKPGQQGDNAAPPNQK